MANSEQHLHTIKRSCAEHAEKETCPPEVHRTTEKLQGAKEERQGDERRYLQAPATGQLIQQQSRSSMDDVRCRGVVLICGALGWCELRGQELEEEEDDDE